MLFLNLKIWRINIVTRVVFKREWVKPQKLEYMCAHLPLSWCLVVHSIILLRKLFFQWFFINSLDSLHPNLFVVFQWFIKFSWRNYDLIITVDCVINSVGKKGSLVLKKMYVILFLWYIFSVICTSQSVYVCEQKAYPRNPKRWGRCACRLNV